MADADTILEINLHPEPGDLQPPNFILEIRRTPNATQVLFGGSLLATLSAAWSHGVSLKTEEGQAHYLGSLAVALKDSHCAPGVSRLELFVVLREMANHILEKGKKP